MDALGLLYLASAFTTLGLASAMTVLAVGQLVALARLPFTLALQLHLRRHGPESFKNEIISPLTGAVLGAVLGGLVSDFISGDRSWVPVAIGVVLLLLLASPLVIERIAFRRPGRRNFVTRLHLLSRSAAARPAFDALNWDISRAVEARKTFDAKIRTVYIVLVGVLLATGTVAVYVNQVVAPLVDEPVDFRQYQVVVLAAPIYGWLFGMTQILIFIPARQRFTVARYLRLRRQVDVERSRAHARRGRRPPTRPQSFSCSRTSSPRLGRSRSGVGKLNGPWVRSSRR